MKILVFIEQRSGKLKANALEALSCAHRLAESSENIAALIIGQNIDNLASEIEGYGADQVYLAQDAALEHYQPLHYAKALEKAINEFKPDMVLGIASPMGRDLLPRMAARFDSGMISDVVEIGVKDNQVYGIKPMYAGKCLARVEIKSSAISFVSLRPNVFPVNKVDKGSGSKTALSLSLDIPGRQETLEIRKGKSERPDLTEAGVIISGGRAMGSAENFNILHECADVLGATVGASRAAVDSGYAPHDMQVGQTGKTVNPNLYIACGISGSIQHMAGMRTSKVIIAINTDAEAPIFKIADYGIIADLFEAVPILTKSLKELLDQ